MNTCRKRHSQLLRHWSKFHFLIGKSFTKKYQLNTMIQLKVNKGRKTERRRPQLEKLERRRLNLE